MKQQFTIRRAAMGDLDAIMEAMQTAVSTAADPSWFVPDCRGNVAAHIGGERGFVLAAEAEDGALAAFFMVDFPGDREDNLGRDVGLAETELSRVAHMDSVAVLPTYRGCRLMARLLEAAQRELAGTAYEYLMCTVHPENRFSLDIVLDHGYRIVMTKEKYGGLLRHILCRRQDPPPILVSACLLGVHCRYNGKGVMEESLLPLLGQVPLIPVCPEIMGGLATPRDPAERVGNRVITKYGADVTAEYEKGAEETLRLARLYGCACAVMKERSPSCGCGQIYDGTHSGTLKDGAGVAAGLLQENGISVFGESRIREVKDFIDDRKKV